MAEFAGSNYLAFKEEITKQTIYIINQQKFNEKHDFLTVFAFLPFF